VLRLIMDAMRHWVTEFGVDGFRFDLAATLARGEAGFDANGPFLAALRQDPRVASYEGHNLRDLDLGLLDGRPVDLVVADVSFISLTLLLPPLTSVLAAGGRLLTMIKPQFEVGRERLGKGGVVRTDELRRAGVQAVVDAAAGLGWHPQAAAVSRLPGPAGNIEYFVCFQLKPPVAGIVDRLFDQNAVPR